MSTPKKPPLAVREESERPTLARILVYEGAVNSVEEFDAALVAAGLDVEAINRGYRDVVALVVGLDGYKAAAKLAKREGGVNQVPESVAMFRKFSEHSSALGDDLTWPVITRALAIHNAASGLARQNGNEPDQQLRLNQKSVALLETIPEADRDGDWWECFRKPWVGLVEAGHVEFDLFMYLRCTMEMIRNGSKDAPGRLEWIIPRLNRDMSALVELVLDQELGAPNQRERLAVLLGHLETFLASLAA